MKAAIYKTTKYKYNAGIFSPKLTKDSVLFFSKGLVWSSVSIHEGKNVWIHKNKIGLILVMKVPGITLCCDY